MRLEIESFDWDGEVYGNPRIVDDQIDIGFDEIHMLVMAGSYGNDSNAHNDNSLPTNVLHPSAAPGSVTRRMILPALFSSQTIRINGTMSTVVPAGLAVPGWIQPPVTLTPALVDPNGVGGYEVKYIAQNNPAPTPTQWNFTGSIVPWQLGAQMGIPWSPVQSHSFVECVLTDNECSTNCTNSYFNTQAYVDMGANAHYRSNLQAEFR